MEGGIERGEAGLGPIPLTAVEQARRAARVGVSLDTVLRRYVLGSTLLGDFLMQDADRDLVGRGAVLREVLASRAVVLDRLLAAITAEYARELERVERSPERSLLESVRSLLAGERADGGAPGVGVGGDVGLGGYELDGVHVGVIARGSGAGALLRGLAVRLDRRLLYVECGEGSAWAWLGGRYGLQMAALERALSGEPSGDVSLALGEPARGLEGWRLTHQQAQAALVVALRRPRLYTRYADVALLATALRDEALARALIDVYIAPLEDSRGSGPVLRQTLRAYLAADCGISSAAAALGVVRKTVETRLRTIEEKLDRALHPCPAELEIALELDELARAPGSPEVPITNKIIA